MSATEGEGTGVSRAEFDELAGGMKSLQDALDELRQARTPAEKNEAQAEVREAKADLNDLARDLGISPKALKAATDQAQRNERAEWIRPILLELLDEELADDLDDAGDALEDTAKGAKGAVEDAAGAKPDDGPTVEHWSDKGLGALFGR